MNEVEAKPVTNTSNAASEEPKTPPKEKKVIGKWSAPHPLVPLAKSVVQC